MKFNIPLPFDRTDEHAGEFHTVDAVAQVGAAIERAGFEGALVTDHPAPTVRWLETGGHQAQDPFVMLSLLAAVTKRIKLQTGILVLPYRNPFITARAIATLDRFSNGRVVLGMAVGYLKGEYKALGVDFDARNDIMDEYLKVLKLALSGDEFTFEGSGYQAFGNRIEPSPVQKPHPPFLIGGNAKRAIRRAVELGDGWYPFFTVGGVNNATTRTAEMATLDDLRAGIAYMNAQCEVFGRETPPSVATGSLTLPGETLSPQGMIDRAGEMAEMGIVATGMNIKGRGLSEWCDNAEHFGAEVIAKMG